MKKVHFYFFAVLFISNISIANAHDDKGLMQKNKYSNYINALETNIENYESEKTTFYAISEWLELYTAEPGKLTRKELKKAKKQIRYWQNKISRIDYKLGCVSAKYIEVVQKSEAIKNHPFAMDDAR